MSGAEAPGLEPAVGARDHVRGPVDATVTLVQFGDFECPYCADVYPVVRRLLNRLGTELRLVFRQFPLTDHHPHAMAAAEATEAAAAQDEDAFWAMHDRLYERGSVPTRSVLVGYAEEVGLDVERFERALDAGTYRDRVRADVASGERSGVDGTPTFFVDGERYHGPLEYEPMLAALAAAGDLRGVRRELDRDDARLRETIDRSRTGAPAAGKALRDVFSADEVFQRVVAAADEEFDRGTRLLFVSGLAAGLCITLSFFARTVTTAALPPGAPAMLGSALYPLGFVFIVIGGYQLYTENTLTPVTLVLTRLASLPALFRVWTVVIVANVLGAGVGAYLLSETGVLAPDLLVVAASFGEHALAVPWTALFWKGVFAGWLVAGMVWLNHAVRDGTARFLLIYLIIFLIPAGDLFHSIIGASEVIFLALQGGTTPAAAFVDFFVPVVLGNTVGGVVFVALLNYGLTRDRRFPDRDRRQPELGWTEWLFGRRIGRAGGAAGPRQPADPRDAAAAGGRLASDAATGRVDASPGGDDPGVGD